MRLPIPSDGPFAGLPGSWLRPGRRWNHCGRRPRRFKPSASRTSGICWCKNSGSAPREGRRFRQSGEAIFLQERHYSREKAMHIINPGEHAPGDIYKLMIGMIVPRPIAFLSTGDAAGVRNLAPFSYFTGCSTNPPVVCFCAAVRSGPRPQKDTLLNIEATGEFVVNIVSEEFAEQMNMTSAEAPPDVDEFVYSGLTPLASDLVRPARVAESKIHLECRLRQI